MCVDHIGRWTRLTRADSGVGCTLTVLASSLVFSWSEAAWAAATHDTVAAERFSGAYAAPRGVIDVVAHHTSGTRVLLAASQTVSERYTSCVRERGESSVENFYVIVAYFGRDVVSSVRVDSSVVRKDGMFDHDVWVHPLQTSTLLRF